MHEDAQITLSTTARMTAALTHAGQAANDRYAAGVFSDYRNRKAAATLAAQDRDLALFMAYLADIDPQDADPWRLNSDPAAWWPITHGMVAEFRQWLVDRGYAVGSVNRALATVRKYAKLAADAGAISTETLGLIRGVNGYGRREGKELDKRRDQCRVGAKAVAPVEIGRDDAVALKSLREDTPRGRRDAVMMTILLDMGLRAGELAGLRVEDLNMAGGVIRFYRSKVNKIQTLRLSSDALRALRVYIGYGDAPASGPLLRASNKSGQLTDRTMTRVSISQRVAALGRAVGLDGLSAHDCRHSWATRLAKGGTPITVIRDAGGWNSLAMPGRYIAENEIANEGAILTW